MKIRISNGVNKKIILAIGFLIFLAGGILAWQYFVPKEEGKAPEEQGKALKAMVKDETANWLIYNWGVLQFKYPADWRVEKDTYRIPGQYAAGEPASIVGLTLFPKNKSTDNYSIRFGGRQIHCGLLGANCFTFYGIPIYTLSESSEILEVFNSFVKTITYNNPNAAFQIIFPEVKTQLESNKTHTIRWKTKTDIQIPKVQLMVFNTSKYGQESLILSVENIPNTGSYEWTVPPTIKFEGSYLTLISYCEPIIPPPAGTIGSCKLYEGWGDSFYISPSNL